MNSSLFKLTENLSDIKCKNTNCNHFHRIDDNRCFETLKNYNITKSHYKDLTPEQIALVCHKRVYPYEYIDSQDRFNETKLSPFHEFHDKLNGKIKLKNYEHIQNIWKEFGCKDLGEYHDL